MNNTQKFIIYFTVTTVTLYLGPSKFARFIPGIRDKLPLVYTRQGLARGETWVSRLGREFSVFRGIPYAKPPVGRRRFLLPEPLGEEDSWRNIRDFLTEVSCPQPGLYTGYYGEENCLVLNIYSRDVSSSAGLPVIVFIHGGRFFSGESGSVVVGPHYFMDEDVVLVTLNYRLGVLGFISMQNEDLQGNQGLWDQRQALVWVKQNIKKFGGDPDLITLMGSSSGAVAVNFHLTSPQSRGLFHRAILQSGSSLAPLGRPIRNPRRYAVELGESLGCRDEDTLLLCLQSIPLKKLVAQQFMFDECGTRWHPWKPAVDRHTRKKFIPEDSAVLLESGRLAQVPVLLGFNEDDGQVYSSPVVQTPQQQTYFLQNLDTCLPMAVLGLHSSEITEEMKENAYTLVEDYAAVKELRLVLPALTQLFGDVIVGAGVHQLSQQLARQNLTVYRYIFSNDGSRFNKELDPTSIPSTILYLSKIALNIFQTLGLVARQEDELIYQFSSNPIVSMLIAQEDDKVSGNFIRWWVNFARTGNPNVNPSSRVEEWETSPTNGIQFNEDSTKRKEELDTDSNNEKEELDTGSTNRINKINLDSTNGVWDPVSALNPWDYWIIGTEAHMETRLDLETRYSKWKHLF